MLVDATGAWVLIGVCCAGALPCVGRAELRASFYDRHRHWREAPGSFAAACVGAALTAAGAGMAVAFAALTLAAIAVRLGA